MIPIAKPIIEAEEKQAVMDVLESGIIAQGPQVAAFEEAFAKICGSTHAVATSSGTTALHTALLANDIGPGDEVITSAFTFIASANSVLYTGARPIFVDIEPATFNIDPRLIEQAITERTRAIMPVHLFGLPCDMDAIMKIAEKHHLAVVEDACQAHGASINGRRVGTYGTAAFSFYPTKNITSGEGGMITTNDEVISEKCRVIRHHGMRRRYYHDELGYNFRMTDLHAAIGLAQTQKLEQFNLARIANADFLSSNLTGVTVPTVPDGYTHVFHQYTIRLPAELRDKLLHHLNATGIGAGVYYPVPIHRQAPYAEGLGYGDELPNTELAAREVLSLPIHPALTDDDLGQIVATVNEFMEDNC